MNECDVRRANEWYNLRRLRRIKEEEEEEQNLRDPGEEVEHRVITVTIRNKKDDTKGGHNG
jgi:hypothetical protein